MPRESTLSRRTLVKATGAAAATAVVAGCNGNDDDDEDAEFEIDPGTEVVFLGEDTWIGSEPAEIDGESNPTLVLEEGEEYTFTWEQGDGRAHNLEIRDDAGDPVDGLASEVTDSPEDDDDLPLEFEASDDMTTYRCQPHPSMEGQIVVE